MNESTNQSINQLINPLIHYLNYIKGCQELPLYCSAYTVLAKMSGYTFS